jgi:hypothetical protein
MSSTADCKHFLGTSTEVAHPGPWRRLSKKKNLDGFERIFASTDNARFVSLLEDASGHLSIGSIGDTLDDVSSPVSPAKASPALRHAPIPASPFEGPRETDPAIIAKVKAMIKRIIARNSNCLEDAAELFVKHPLATANQFVFAVSLDHERNGFVEIIPRAYWERTRLFFDFHLPIEGVIPSEDAESPNESSSFLVPDFDGDVKKTAVALIAAGFQWNADVQATLNQLRQVKRSTAKRFADFMQSEDLAKRLSAPAKPKKPPKPYLVRQAVSVDDLEAQVAVSHLERPMISTSLKDPPNLVALIVMPGPSDRASQDPQMLAYFNDIAKPADKGGVRVVLVPSESPAAQELRTRVSASLMDWDVVAIREGKFSLVNNPPRRPLSGPEGVIPFSLGDYFTRIRDARNKRLAGPKP